MPDSMETENGGANHEQQIVVSDKAQQPNGDPGQQIVVSSEVRTGLCRHSHSH
jgi:hypothetical protein